MCLYVYKPSISHDSSGSRLGAPVAVWTSPDRGDARGRTTLVYTTLELGMNAERAIWFRI